LEKGIIRIENMFADLDEVIAGKKKGKTSEDDITAFFNRTFPAGCSNCSYCFLRKRGEAILASESPS
jgi:hypothetical protein